MTSFCYFAVLASYRGPELQEAKTQLPRMISCTRSPLRPRRDTTNASSAMGREICAPFCKTVSGCTGDSAAAASGTMSDIEEMDVVVVAGPGGEASEAPASKKRKSGTGKGVKALDPYPAVPWVWANTSDVSSGKGSSVSHLFSRRRGSSRSSCSRRTRCLYQRSADPIA